MIFANSVDSYNKWYLIPVNEDLTTGLYLEAEATYSATENFKISETSADGIITSYNSNQNNGFLYSTTTDGIITGYAQEENTGRVWRVIKDSMRVFYSYTNEKLSKITTPTTEYTFTYDALGRNTRIESGNYTLSETSYNTNGLVASQSLLNGTDTKEYTYDELDRIKTEKINSDILSYYYGSDGNISYITDSKTGKRTQYEYDLADRVVSVKEFNGEEAYLFDLDSSLSYTYVDGTNQISSITVKNDLGENELDITYGSAVNGRMPDAVYSEWWNNIWCRSYSYDSLGRLSTVGTRAGIGSTWLESTYTYKTDGNKTTSQVSSLSTPDRDYTYTYDNRGNITAIYDGECYTIYEYDNLDQLIRENNQRENVTYVYSYSDGNIVSRTKYIYTLGDPSTEISADTWTYGDSTWGDVLTAYNGVSTAVNNGRITALNGKSLTYSYLGLLATAGTTSFDYDTTGRRLSKTTGSATTNYYYAGDLLVGEKTGSNKIEFLYDSNGDYYGFEYNDTAYYYIKNLQGDVTAIADSSGNIICRYFYDAWGRLLETDDDSANSIGTINPIRYRSYYYDTETGFYYLNSRYYSPEICRFISPDCVIDDSGVNTQNLFSYCANNPITREDSGGQFWNVVAGAVIGGISGFVPAVINEIFFEERDDSFKAFGRIMTSTLVGAAEGALISIFPSAGMVIGAVSGVVESMINGCISNDTPHEIVISAIVSGTVGALADAAGGSFTKGKFVNEFADAVKTVLVKDVKKSLKKQAKHTINKLGIRMGKIFLLDFAESFAYDVVTEGASKFGKIQYEYYFEKLK